MTEIDFLPIEYHQKSAQRRQQPWRTVVLLAFLALLGAASLVEHQRRHRLRADIDAIRPQHDKATRQMKQLADLQSLAQTARAEADLHTYLRHPWPRTQILAALLATLPKEIVLEQLKILEEPPDRRAPAKAAERPDPKAEEAERVGLPAAARDLKRLRAEFDPLQTNVILTGSTTEGAALHRYLSELGKTGLFRKVQLRSVETVKGDGEPVMRFVAAILVRPGYGQPGGPVPASNTPLAQTDNRSPAPVLDKPGMVQKGGLKKVSGTVVRSTLRAVPATVPDTFLNPATVPDTFLNLP